MISRVAESCFWLGRYMERATSVARLVAVNRLIVLDAQIEGAERWKPAVVVVGERERFEKTHGAAAYAKDATAARFLTWDVDNPNSAISCLRAARENARTTREVISREMWEAVNECWQWINSSAGERVYRNDPTAFFQRLRRANSEFHGEAQAAMLHGEPYDFLRMGEALETVEQSARLLDSHHHRLSGDVSAQSEGPLQSAQWFAQLRLASAVESFFKSTRKEPTASGVARFLIQNAAFPRSVLHGLEAFIRHQQTVLDSIAEARSEGAAALQLARESAKTVRELNIPELVSESNLHKALTDVVQCSADIGQLVRTAFFHVED